MLQRHPRRATLGERVGAILHRLGCAAAALAVTATASAQAAPPGDDPPSTVVRERLTVTDSRLRDRPTDGDKVPAHITVLDREAIAAARAVNPQELLAREAGVVLFDSTGSDLQKTLDLRGFTGGGVRVFLDGAPLNDPRNNSLSLELVPPAALDRIEISRGSGSASAGGGSEAGVINLWTRAGDRSGGSLELGAGSHDRTDGSLAGWGRGGVTDWFGVASIFDSDGFRDNGGARLGRFAGTAGWQAAGGELRLSLLYGDGLFGNPGALRPDELAVDRGQAPFNELDFSDELQTQATLNYDGLLTSSLSLRANVYARDREREILTTGRAAPAFGGFLLDTDARLTGSTVQLGHFGGSHEVAAGVDWLDADTDALGFSTPPADPGRVERSAPGSDNLTTRRTTAIYLRDRWQPSKRLTVTLAGRWDDDRVGYREALPDPANVARRTYTELSLRSGLTWALSSGVSLYAAYGEAFLPPTVEELFSFPLFGSNPQLEPEDSRSLELGLRRFGAGHDIQAALFRVDTRDEIVFDPDSPQGLFGANVNAGETRRQGAELVYRGRPRPDFSWFVTATAVDAELASGPNRGNTVPLVPDLRLSAGVEIALAPTLDLAADVLRVGEQVLSNDDANLERPLDPYTVVNLRLAWDLARSTGRDTAPRLFITATNLFDEEYSTRGIFAFDFSTFTSSAFFTPAPDRQLAVGVGWEF